MSSTLGKENPNATSAMTSQTGNTQLRSSIDMKTSFYGTNQFLKRSNVTMNLTAWEKREIMRCKADVHYFLRNYYMIKNVDKGLIPLKLYDYQIEMIDAIHENRFTITNSSRQSGKTTTTAAYLLWYVLFNKDKECLIIANKVPLAKEILNRIVTALQNVPFFLQQGVTDKSAVTIGFENRSRIKAMSEEAARGNSASFILCDEVAFYDNFKEFWAATYPVLSSGTTTKAAILSTPNGIGDGFHTMWEAANHPDASKRSEFFPIEVPWTKVPRDKSDNPTPESEALAKQKFKEATIRNTSIDAWEVEFECKFAGANNALINGHCIKQITNPDPVYRQDELKLFELPLIGHKYIISCDVSHGKGLDKTAITIFDVTQYPLKMVGMFYDDKISPLLLPNLLVKLGENYNNAGMLIESNDIGKQVVHDVGMELEYEHLISPQTKRATSSGMFEDGLRTTAYTKSIGCSTMRDLLEAEKMILKSVEVQTELSGFVAKGKSYEASQGYHDDLTMSIVNFSYLTTTEEFEEYCDDNLRNQLFAKRLQALEEDVLPMPIIDDGLDEEDAIEYVEGFGVVNSNDY